jgi:hypothetical protein
MSAWSREDTTAKEGKNKPKPPQRIRRFRMARGRSGCWKLPSMNEIERLNRDLDPEISDGLRNQRGDYHSQFSTCHSEIMKFFLVSSRTIVLHNSQWVGLLQQKQALSFPFFTELN